MITNIELWLMFIAGLLIGFAIGIWFTLWQLKKLKLKDILVLFKFKRKKEIKEKLTDKQKEKILNLRLEAIKFVGNFYVNLITFAIILLLTLITIFAQEKVQEYLGFKNAPTLVLYSFLGVVIGEIAFLVIIFIIHSKYIKAQQNLAEHI